MPVARQVLYALGDTVAAEGEALEDAELALTEACANAVEHAYPDRDGIVEITLLPRDDDVLVSVRDFGRGMPPDGVEPPGGRGHGLLARFASTSVPNDAGEEGLHRLPRGTAVVPTAMSHASRSCTGGDGGDGGDAERQIHSWSSVGWSQRGAAQPGTQPSLASFTLDTTSTCSMARRHRRSTSRPSSTGQKSGQRTPPKPDEHRPRAEPSPATGAFSRWLQWE